MILNEPCSVPAEGMKAPLLLQKQKFFHKKIILFEIKYFKRATFLEAVLFKN